MINNIFSRSLSFEWWLVCQENQFGSRFDLGLGWLTVGRSQTDLTHSVFIVALDKFCPHNRTDNRTVYQPTHFKELILIL